MNSGQPLPTPPKRFKWTLLFNFKANSSAENKANSSTENKANSSTEN